ncbi:MAG: glycosyltransferase family 2 protein [Deltaproteobacteria bacterium]|nr:glycosyltransferase family 2 protein [Deltaproteobacteria bacterium]MBW2444743.1 glycosyltransferase family 2 protein [Deltaproteobacteria bacterium]
MKLGVVIPTLDEADAVEAALCSVVDSGPGDDGPEPTLPERSDLEPVELEIVVADGGSRDETCQRARTWGSEMAAAGLLHTRVIELPADREAGRARQLQAGFEACGGDAVLFLHADTRLPAGWARDVRHALRDPAVVGGAFRFRFDPDEMARGRTLGLRVIEWGARLRVALFGLPYGDQAIFARRRTLEAIGGVPQVPMMEDLDLVAALKRQGRLARLAAPATTSPRRYREDGVLRVFVRNVLALSAWRLGFDRARVAAWYRS